MRVGLLRENRRKPNAPPQIALPCPHERLSKKSIFERANKKACAAGASGESEQVNIAFKKYGWGDDFKRFYGNAKVEAAAYVYNRKDGKLLGQKFTSKAFADKIEKKLKTEMQNAANENMLK